MTATTPAVEEDPPLDDLLDSVLDEMDLASLKPPVPEPPVLADTPDEFANEDWMRQLTADMETLLSGKGGSALADGSDPPEFPLEGLDANEAQLMQQFAQAFLQQLDPSAAASPSFPVAPPSTDNSTDKINPSTTANDFQSKLDETMERLKQSDTRVREQVQEGSSVSGEKALLESLLQQLASSNLNADPSSASPDSLENVMDTMLQQLLSKDVLYEPIKELADQYPQWLAENKSKLSAEDLDRYQKQYSYCSQMVTLFDQMPPTEAASGGSEESKKSEYQQAMMVEVMECMNKMQEYGQPPPGLIDKLAPGIQWGADGLPKALDGMDKDCCIM